VAFIETGIKDLKDFSHFPGLNAATILRRRAGRTPQGVDFVWGRKKIHFVLATGRLGRSTSRLIGGCPKV
jgi:hypothetical protein